MSGPERAHERSSPEHEARGTDDRERRATHAHRARSEDEKERITSEPSAGSGKRADFARTLEATPRVAARTAAKPTDAPEAPVEGDLVVDDASATNTSTLATPTAEGELLEEAAPRAHVDPLASLLEADAFGAALVAEPELDLEFDPGALEFTAETGDPLASDALSTVLDPTTMPGSERTQAGRSATSLPDPSASGTITNEARPEAAKSAAPEARPTLPRPIDDARAADVLRQVRLELVPQLKEAVIQLHPAELGRISIRLTIEDEGLVARVRAEKREALDALERHLPELRAALSRQGVETQHVDLALGFHDERRANEGRSDRSQRGRPNRDEDSVTNAGELSPRLRRMASSGGIDTYA